MTGESDETPKLIDLRPEELLGISDNPDLVARRYDGLRQVAAGNILGVLAAQSSEYRSRQSIKNREFVDQAVRLLPQAVFTARMRPYDESAVECLQPSFRFQANSGALTSVDSAMVAELSAIRASTIWVKQEVKTMFDVQKPDHCYITRGSVWIPSVLVGHKTDDLSGQTSIILRPAVALPPPSPHNPDTYQSNLYKSDGTSVQGIILPLNRLIKSRMTNDHFDRLIGLQDALMTESFSDDQAQAMHDTATDTFVIDPTRLGVVKAKPVTFLAWRKAPGSVKDLEDDEFNIHQTFGIENVDEPISPDDFVDFNIADDLLRAAAMLGRVPSFEALKTQFISSTLEDPEIKFLNRPTQ